MRRPPLFGWTVLAAGALLVLAPLYFTFVFATHQRNSIFNVPPPLFFGGSAGANLDLLLASLPFWRNLGISVYVAACAVVTLVAVGSYRETHHRDLAADDAVDVVAAVR